jgi:hypothetical protein
MKNLKNYQSFNEELSPETYDKIRKTGVNRGDLRGYRLTNTADMLQRQNSVKINLYNNEGDLLDKVIPIGASQDHDYSYIIELSNFNKIILSSITNNYDGSIIMKATYSIIDNPRVLFDRVGKKYIIDLFAKNGLILNTKEQTAIPMI